jgi:small subunit ribosomal protein S9
MKIDYLGTGRRKNAVARVRLLAGEGNVVINGKNGTNYLQFNPSYILSVKSPLETLGLEDSYDIVVQTNGGGLTGQADAIKMGVARALCELDPSNRIPLKREGFLTRDSRSKERKKYGLKKARKASQFSKR